LRAQAVLRFRVMPENRNGTGEHHLALAGEATRFKPGQSGNPGGRPKGLAKTIRARYNDSPLELVEMLDAVARDPDVRPADRIQAVRALIEHGWGKAASFAAIEGTDPLEMGDVEAEIRRIADELAAARSAA
jgi:hypothetical protein